MAVDADQLSEFATAILAYAGKDIDRAKQVAARLVGANLAGHDSHGVGMIPAYVDGILAGQLDPLADIELVQDKGPFLLVDGHRGFGHIIAEQAMALAIDRAHSSHFAVLSLRNSFHLVGWEIGAPWRQRRALSAFCTRMFSHRGLLWRRLAVVTHVLSPILIVPRYLRPKSTRCLCWIWRPAPLPWARHVLRS